MLLQYGPISLNFLTVEAYERVPVFHGPNYLYTRHKITVTGTFSPPTQSDRLANDQAPNFNAAHGGTLQDANGNALTFVPATVPNVLPAPVGPLTPSVPGLPPLGSFPNNNTGRPGAYTAESVKHDLAQPRQILIFSVGGQVLLRSPFPGLTVDCTLGPKTSDISVTKMMGTRTFKVRLTIETDVNEAPLRYQTFLRNVLSHRWSMEHDLGADFFVKKVVTGRVVFRSDILAKAGRTPDDFRRFFFYPVPAGFARREVNVKALDDQVTVDYRVVDEQLPIGWTLAGVTRIQASHTVKYTKAETERTVARNAGDAWNKIAEAISRGGLLKDFNINPLIAAGMQAIGGVAGSVYNALPVLMHDVQVHVWGGPSSTRASMRAFAANIINARLSSITALGLFLGGHEIEYTDIITGKEVQARVTITTGPAGTIIGVGQVANVDQFFPNTDDTGGLLGLPVGTLLVAGGGSSTTPSDDDKGRDGSYLEACIAGALTGDAAQGNQVPFSPSAQTRATVDQAPSTTF